MEKLQTWRNRLFFSTDYDWAHRQSALMRHARQTSEEKRDKAFFDALYLEALGGLIDGMGAGQDFFALSACSGEGVASGLMDRGVRVEGFDIFPDDIARLNAKGSGAFFETGLTEGLGRYARASVPLLICLEALSEEARFKEALRQMFKVVQPGGAAAISVRTKAYWLSRFKEEGDARMARTVEKGTEGRMPWGDICSWFTADESKAALEKAGFSDIQLSAIGIYAGLESGEPASVSRPGSLDDEQRRRLMDLERKAAPLNPDRGQFMLAIARKPL